MKQYKDTDYYITENGEVYSKKWSTINPNCELRKMKPHIGSNGYYQIGICENAFRKIKSVHRLVAECYLPNPDNLPLVEHKDDIKTNNHVSNLMWSTHSNNNGNAIKNGLKNMPKGEKNSNSKLTEEQIKWIRDNYIQYDKEFGGKSLSIKFGISQSQIHRIINNKLWNHI
jgi:hypothetical protein